MPLPRGAPYSTKAGEGTELDDEVWKSALVLLEALLEARRMVGRLAA
jgi:hypothetical protein